jgi:FtsH-binding integral membrane protein
MQKFEERTEYNTTVSGARALPINAFMRGVYWWMSAGLSLTALVAWMVFESESIQELVYANEFVFIGFILAQLGMVIYLSARVQKLSGSTATTLFMIYSALTGVTFSVFLMAYNMPSSATGCFIPAGTFGATSVYGMVTKRDLTGVGGFMMMGLIGIIIASIVNIFMQNDMVYMVISYIGVIVFVGLTAYDTQRLRVMGESVPADDPEAVRRGTIMGALALYLDFINLFIMMLRIFGTRR